MRRGAAGDTSPLEDDEDDADEEAESLVFSDVAHADNPPRLDVSNKIRQNRRNIVLSIPAKRLRCQRFSENDRSIVEQLPITKRKRCVMTQS